MLILKILFMILLYSFVNDGQNMVADSEFTGSLRVAGVWDGVEGDVATLDEHAGVVPTAGTVSAEVAGNIAFMNYNWETVGSGNLLMMALPHHLDTIKTTQTNHKLHALKGN